MTDSRADDQPRPRYGAYASPEEQAARSGREAPVVDPALVPRDMPPEAPGSPARRPAAPAPQGRSSLADRIVTILLMAIGLYYVLGSIGLYTDPSALADAMRLDVELSDYAGQRGAGIAAVVVMLVGWLATVWFLWRRGARGRSMWWIALLAGVVFNFVGTLIVAIPFAMDPNVMQAFMEMQGIEQP